MADFDKNFDYYAYYKQGGQASQRPQGVQYKIDPLVSPVVDNAFFKQHARIDFDTDDALVTSYIAAATLHLEHYCQKSFGTRTVTLHARYLPVDYKLMYGPVASVTSGQDVIGDILTESVTDDTVIYDTDSNLSTDPTVKVAICRYAAGLYMERENVTESKWANSNLKGEAEKMLQPYRNVIFP